jgi:hypothetical protein
MGASDLVQNIEAIPAALLIFPGALYLFFGWQLYRLTLAATAAVFGALVGAALASSFAALRPWGVLLTVAVTLIFTGIAVPLQRLALFILGGLGGFALVLLAYASFETEVAFLFWGIMAFLAGGSCAVVFLRPLVILSTALLGGLVVTRSVAILLHQASSRLDEVGKIICAPKFFLVFLCLFGLGILCQTTSRWRYPEAPPPEAPEPPAPLPPIIPLPPSEAQSD